MNNTNTLSQAITARFEREIAKANKALKQGGMTPVQTAYFKLLKQRAQQALKMSNEDEAWAHFIGK